MPRKRIVLPHAVLVAVVMAVTTVANADRVDLDRHLQSVEELDIPDLLVSVMSLAPSSITALDDDEDAEDAEEEEDPADWPESTLWNEAVDDAAEQIVLSRGRAKRFLVDFNGMKVSYPTYVRLMRLQAKVLRLQSMIQLLHQRYTQEQLDELPQYQRLIALYNSLKPLLPGETGSAAAAAAAAAAAGDHGADALVPNGNRHAPFDASSFMLMLNKRSPAFTMSFMGMEVTYPQYLRLVALQEKVIRLDKIIRKLREQVPLDELERVPTWHKLVALHESLRKILPPDYLAHYNGAEAMRIPGTGLHRMDISKRSTTDFNGVSVSLPEYARLMGRQRSVLRLDAMMRQIAQSVPAEALASEPRWRQLLALRQSLQALLPEGHPHFQHKRTTTDFNGVQVSLPEYARLLSLQRKVQKLDAVMAKIAQMKSAEELATLPQWRKLQELRRALVNLLPMSNA